MISPDIILEVIDSHIKAADPLEDPTMLLTLNSYRKELVELIKLLEDFDSYDTRQVLRILLKKQLRELLDVKFARVMGMIEKLNFSEKRQP